MTRSRVVAVLAVLAVSACIQRPSSDPNIIIIGLASGPNNLDPRRATDDAAQKTDQLIFNGLMRFDEHLNIVPDLAERLENPTPTTYVAALRHGVRFHDGHELTSADVVFTYRSVLDPAFLSPFRAAFRGLEQVEAVDRYTVRFTLKEPFGSFPVNLVLPGIVPEGAGPDFRNHLIGTGPYRFVRYVVDDRIELTAFEGYSGGRPRNDGVVLRIVPDEIMLGLELRKGTMDVVVNTFGPDIVHQLEGDANLQLVKGPGTDYQYIGLNLRDPALADVRVRQAIGYAIDRQAIVDYLRRGLAGVAVGILPPVSWAFEPDVFTFSYDPARAKSLLDAAGYADPDGDGPAPRLRLTLKTSNLEFPRLQATVIQQNLRAVGIELDIRTYEFATMYADVLKGNFQMYTLQWTGGAVADPDILRRIFHSSQVPPAGFNRGFFHDARVDQLLDEASVTTDMTARRGLYGKVQQILAEEAPYISLWYKTNATVARRSLSGILVAPTAELTFLKDVSRRPASPQATH